MTNTPAEAPVPVIVEWLRNGACNECCHRAEEAADEIKRLTAEVQRLKAALLKVTDALNQGRIVPSGHGVSGMTIEAQMRASVYNGVPVWPIEEAREILDEVNARAALKEPRT